MDWTNFAPEKVMLSKDDTTPYEGAAIPGNLFDSDQKLHICIVDGTTYTDTLVVPAGVAAVGTSGFYGTSFQTVDFKNNLPDVKQVGYYSFADMQSLKALTIPGYMQFVLGGQDKTLSNAFSEVFNATSMVIEEGIKVIPASMARQWNSMETLQLPSTITKIENRAFDNAKRLHSVDMSKITGPLTVNTAFNTWGKEAAPVNCVFYVNSSNIQTVLNNDNWGTRSNHKIFAVTNGGTFPADTTFESGKLATPTKDSCAFAGWYTKDGTNGDWGDKVTSSTKLTAGATYYAKWNTAVLSGNCGAKGNEKNVHWALTKNTDRTTYTLTISGDGAMADYTANINNEKKATQPWRASKTGVEIEKITKVVVSEDVTSIDEFAFNGLTGVSEYDIGAKVSTIKQWALDTSSAKAFNLKENTNFQTDVDGVLFNKDGTTLIAYPGGSAVQDEYTVPPTVNAISDGAFVGCPIKKLTIDDNVTTELPGWSFNGDELEELDVNCRFGQSTFAQITTLEKVTLGDSIKEIPNMAFLKCTGLQSVNIPSNLTKIGTQAFFGCSRLQNVTLPESLTEIGYQAFRDCDALTSITFPDNLQNLGEQAFLITTDEGHTGSLTTVTFGAKIPSFLTTSGNPSTNPQLFKGQDKLKTVDMSKCKNTTISAGLFNGLTALKTIIFPTGLTEIGDSAFTNCSGLKSLEFPDSLTKIGESAFSGCTGLTYISYGSGINDIGRNAFGGCTNVKVIDLHRATQIDEAYDNGSGNGDPALTHACIAAAQKVKYYLRTEKQANSVKGNLEWGDNGAGTGNITNTYYILTAKDAVPDYTGETDTPTRAGYTFDQWDKVTVRDGSTTTENVYTDANRWSLASPTVTVSPASANTYVNGTVTLTATVSEPVAGFTYSYQWYSNTSNSNEGGTEISEATSAMYSPNITAAGTTYYYCVVTVKNGSDTAVATTAVVPVTAASHAGSSSSNPTYSVTTPSKSENGGVAVSSKNARKGDTVTVTVTPDAGYQLDKLTVTDKNGNVLKLTDKGDGKYSFTMPDGKVEVKAVFVKKVETSPFGDVSTDAYYYKAVQWAQEKGITDGISSDLFGPKQPCTRSQIVTFLWRAAGSPEPKGTAAGMTDVVPGSYYAKAVAWAVENGITTGTAEGTFSPDATCTRAQAVTFLARAQNAKATGKTAFSDVPADSYFADAVAWAQANGVTTGTSETTFSPDSDCTRAQIVTFLYRANQGT